MVRYSKNTTYRVLMMSDEMWGVTSYPHISEGDIQQGHYRFDLLPTWMREGITLLMVAGGNVAIHGVGKRVGDTFWLGPIDIQ